MTTYRNDLPQLSGKPFLTDAGLETVLIFEDGIDLPEFAAFTALADPAQRAALDRYFEACATVAERSGMGMVIETPTWRASSDYGAKLGYSGDELAAAVIESVEAVEQVRRRVDSPENPIVVSGSIGPRGDGYVAGTQMTAEEAQAYHATQVETFAATTVDLVSCATMTYVGEAIGITRAAQAAGVPVVVSFTVETDGRLPSGDSLADAIAAVDAATDNGPAYYMINCAHPSHFEHVLAGGEASLQRLRAIRANASKRSHAELDEATELDAGNPVELGAELCTIRDEHPNISILGGCCGTSHVHLDAIAAVPAGQL